MALVTCPSFTLLRRGGPGAQSIKHFADARAALRLRLQKPAKSGVDAGVTATIVAMRLRGPPGRGSGHGDPEAVAERRWEEAARPRGLLGSEEGAPVVGLEAEVDGGARLGSERSEKRGACRESHAVVVVVCVFLCAGGGRALGLFMFLGAPMEVSLEVSQRRFILHFTSP
jgi:hypothetical protein